jgi:sigma-B regulation protein RsbU (phosphoserine phosphatase)
MRVDDTPEAEAYDVAPCGLVSTLANGTIYRVNRTFCEWFGFAPDELVETRRLQDLMTMGCKIFHQTHWLPLLELQGSVAEVQLELVHRDGHAIPVLVNARQRLAQASTVHEIAVFIAADRRKYERELLDARRRAEELVETVRTAQEALTGEAQQRAVFAEQLIGIVSHDLRTPLHAVSLGASLLASSALAPVQLRTVNRITSAVQRANRLIVDLLDFTQARLGSGLRVVPTELDLHAVVADVVDELKLAWPGRMMEHRQQGAGAGFADPDRLAQVVTNLATNALTYGQPDQAVTITSIVGDGELAIEVHNAGAAIPEELVPHIFEPLRRGEQQVKLGSRSVGLGLYIVQQISAAHRGRVAVRSSDDEGTTFSVSVPRALSTPAHS